MKKAILSLVLLSLLVPFNAVLTAQDEHPAMQPDNETMQRWIDSYNSAPEAFIDPAIQMKRGSKSLLPYVPYNPDERNQGSCGNCWAWAGTGVMEVAHRVQDNIFDRLSVQYINSCETSVIGKTCCTGGWLEDVADFYTYTGKAVPWANSGAYWQDGDQSCDTSCSSVSTSPSYSVNSISESTIATYGVGKETAISNIKNVLNQNKAVWFAFFVSSQANWDVFSNWWNTTGESAVFSFDYACSQWQTKRLGHAVLCVGYNDDNPSNRYWIMLNSWGTNAGRPNGLFRLTMDMNYNCQESGTGYQNMFWQTLDVSFSGGPIPTPTPKPSYPVRVDPDQTSFWASSGGMYLYASTDYITTWCYPFVRIVTPSYGTYYLTSWYTMYPYPMPYTSYPIQTTGPISNLYLCGIWWRNLNPGTYYVESGAVNAYDLSLLGPVYQRAFTLN
jgi:hypothetical protein